MAAEAQAPENPLRDSAHPTTVFFTVAFKVLALLVYIFMDFFVKDFVLVFIVILILLAADFWTVKNVSGRLLVGMRWWNRVHPDGTSEWVFESSAKKHPNRFDRLIFWMTLYITPVAWAIVGLIFSGIEWLMVIAVAIGLACTNLVMYWKCLRSGRANLKKFATKQAAAIAIQSAANAV